jgi:outer membrane immunogenic protein
MKRFVASAAVLGALTVVSANAADMPMKAPPAPVVAPWTWTGFYAGLNIGYSWGRSDTDLALFDNTTGALLAAGNQDFHLNGVIGGGQIGYNWQWSNFVLGVEADIQGSGQKGDAAFLCPGTVCNAGLTAVAAANAPVAGTFNQKLDWFGTLRARAGVAVTPTILAYVTGGLAYGHVETDGTLTGFTGGGVATSSAFNSGKTKAGWTVGGGVEGRITGNWTAKVEYLYMDLGTVDTTGLLTTNFIPIRAQFSSKITDNIVRVGFNYKFN